MTGTTTVANGYHYVNNSPLNLADPSGLSPSGRTSVDDEAFRTATLGGRAQPGSSDAARASVIFDPPPTFNDDLAVTHGAIVGNTVTPATGIDVSFNVGRAAREAHIDAYLLYAILKGESEGYIRQCSAYGTLCDYMSRARSIIPMLGGDDGRVGVAGIHNYRIVEAVDTASDNGNNLGIKSKLDLQGVGKAELSSRVAAWILRAGHEKMISFAEKEGVPVMTTLSPSAASLIRGSGREIVHSYYLMAGHYYRPFFIDQTFYGQCHLGRSNRVVDSVASRVGGCLGPFMYDKATGEGRDCGRRNFDEANAARGSR